MASLNFVKINKIYDNNVQAVFDFELEVKDKEFIVFVGPSGCGKSTTLRMIAGLESITTGELYIDDKLVNYIAPKDRHIAMVFQSYALYPHMTVYDNMAFSLKIRKTFRPVYKYNEECKQIEKELVELRRVYNKNSKAFSKAPNNEEYIRKEESLRKQLVELYEKLFATRESVIGIDEDHIKRDEKEIVKLQSEISKIEKMIVKEKARAEINEQLVQTMQRDIEYKQKEIQKLSENIEWLKVNEVQIEKARHLSKSEIDYQVLTSAEILDLVKYLSRKPAALSGGQRQRVALGRAIVRKPRVFLMDEPLSNLDAKLRVQTRGEIARIHKKVGATTIYVTHDQTEAMTLADRIVIMKDGYIQQIAKPKDAYDNPRNMFVAGFIGSPAMNFINGVIEKGKFVIDSACSISLNKELVELTKDYEGKKVVLGIRPEDVFVEKTLDKKLSEPLSISVDDFEMLGHEQVIYSEAFANRIAVKTSASNSFEIGSSLNVYLDLQKVHFFDKETTLNLSLKAKGE